MKRFLWQSSIIFLSCLLVLVWQQTILSQFTIQALAFLAIVYLLSSIRKKGQKSEVFIGTRLDIFLLNTAVLLLVFATGGMNSNFFFLLYFLVFGVAFVFSPSAVFVFLIFIILLFVPLIIKDDISGNILRVGFLVLTSPIAFFFGKEYRKSQKEEAIIKDLTHTSSVVSEAITADAVRLEKEPLSSSSQKVVSDIKSQAKKLEKASGKKSRI